ncbi:MAG: 2-oxo acid dehydrogenase subunit E2, partial [Methanocella sp.]
MDIVLDQLLAVREELTPALEASRGVRLSLNDLLAKAVSAVLPEFRLLNAYVSDREVVLQPLVNLGVAVASDRGLVVPVIRDAASLALPDLVGELKRLTSAARQGTLAPDDLAGGTFTLSNLGMFGVRSFTAIVNPPQTAILAVGGAREEVKLSARGLFVQTVASFTLTCDHRAVDGALAAGFLKRLAELLEGPELRKL